MSWSDENTSRKLKKFTLSRDGISSNFFCFPFSAVLPTTVQIPCSVFFKSFFPGKSFSSLAVRRASHLFSISSKIVRSSASRNCRRTADTRGARDVGYVSERLRKAGKEVTVDDAIVGLSTCMALSKGERLCAEMINWRVSMISNSFKSSTAPNACSMEFWKWGRVFSIRCRKSRKKKNRFTQSFLALRAPNRHPGTSIMALQTTWFLRRYRMISGE